MLGHASSNWAIFKVGSLLQGNVALCCVPYGAQFPDSRPSNIYSSSPVRRFVPDEDSRDLCFSSVKETWTNHVFSTLLFFFPLALHLSFLFGLSESLCVRGVLLGPQYLWQAAYASKVTPPSRRGNTSHQTHHSNTIPHGPH